VDDQVIARRALDRLRSGDRSGDEGITLTEVMVAMTIMAILMSIFTGAVLSMYRSADRVEAVSQAQSQNNTVFLRLDTAIRYASAISAPNTVGGNPYVEFLTSNTSTPVCTELRLNVSASQLQIRTWDQGATPLVPSAWIPIASNVTATTPFQFLDADATYNFQRLRLTLVADMKSDGIPAASTTDVTFTALNTQLGTATTTVCTEGRAIP
jgi:prepilin-type N-terminal cleavage/methylation domain-containing protein